MFERDNISQWDRDTYNYACRNTFNNWAEFVSMHYALSERDDSKYWKDNLDREYDKGISDLSAMQSHGFREHINNKIYNFRYGEDSGIACISAGYGYFPLSDNTLKYANRVEKFDYTPYLLPIKHMDNRKKEWDELVKDSPISDMEDNINALLKGTFTKMDLINREEYDVQTEVLKKTRAKVEALETKIKDIEKKLK